MDSMIYDFLRRVILRSSELGKGATSEAEKFHFRAVNVCVGVCVNVCCVAAVVKDSSC